MNQQDWANLSAWSATIRRRQEQVAREHEKRAKAEAAPKKAAEAIPGALGDQQKPVRKTVRRKK